MNLTFIKYTNKENFQISTNIKWKDFKFQILNQIKSTFNWNINLLISKKKKKIPNVKAWFKLHYQSLIFIFK